ncbi:MULTISPECIES: RodZ domain-containing protein [unclassified Bacillus (in: firmicutes)]|uniref:helix-turn-helix domain-containing protein n=1 Tax=unclassified Bacillus (in: firmicutes) TaxID=185979 RepID=UPI000BF01CC4|nr:MULTISPECIES: RodZ domain-containing protein [unclassified Bacillus (in: firmicutes)]PEJ60185.1 helix-turn-helix domain-containing protein [Bacillus sp. AFS002410]PEK98589.1 helix-turn-helix domain-containing protein [Bacillus sp. AFS017336]
MTELGKFLKEAREAKGLSIDDVQELTKIQKRYLEAIEEGNYEILPGQFYVRAFIRQYAETIGVDVSGFLSDKPVVEDTVEANTITEEVKHEEIPSRASKLKEPLNNVKSSRVMDYLPRILIAILIMGICIAIYMMLPSKNDEKSADTNQSQTNSNSEIEKPKNNALDQVKNDNKKQTEKAKNDETKQEPTQKITVDAAQGKRTSISLSGTDVFKLEVVANGESYVDLKNASGKMFYSGILKQGQTQNYDLTEENEVTVNIGASNNVELRINDEVFKYPVSPTNAVHQKITIKNLKMNQ